MIADQNFYDICFTFFILWLRPKVKIATTVQHWIYQNYWKHLLKIYATCDPTMRVLQEAPRSSPQEAPIEFYTIGSPQRYILFNRNFLESPHELK